MGGVKNIWVSNIYYYVTAPPLFHFFRSNHKSEVFLLKSSSGNLNASIVILADILKFTISVLERNF